MKSFALAGPALRLTVAILSVAHTMAHWTGELNSKLSPDIDNPILCARLQLLPSVLLFCIEAMENVISQISRMSLMSVPMQNSMAYSLVS